MCKKFSFLLFLLVSSFSFAQKDKELFRINDKQVFVSEFEEVYKKNLDIVDNEDSKNIDNYLNLYINYKLKVQEAYNLKLDTLKKYKRELEGYKKQLIAPYLQDEAYLERLVKESYTRKKTDVKVSHILIKIPKANSIEVDTSFLYKQITDARERILKGESFESVAKEVSEDPSVKLNGGNLGYFSVFKMVYPFEDMAYNTEKGAVSKPFKTRFGYHIIKVDDKRPSKGEFEVAHILVRGKGTIGKTKIDSAYQKLKSGVDFNEVVKQYSEDVGTVSLGGKLPKFGTGSMVEPFENTVRELQSIGAYSKPFKTRFGWHIVKLLKKYPIGSFDEEKKELIRKVKSTSRATLSKQSVIDKLKKEYKVVENNQALIDFFNSNTHQLKKKDLKEVLFSIEDKNVYQKEFLKFIGHNHNPSIKSLYEKFKNHQIIEYFKEDLVNKEPAYKHTLLEYKEGLLLFDLMQKEIWDKSSKDTSGLKEFYLSNQDKYNKKLEEIRGLVMNDYQKQLEKELVNDLKKKSTIVIKERALKKLKKKYNQS